MRTLTSLLAVAAIAAFGFTGSAMAADQTIVDGDAESGLTNWNTSGAEVQTVGSAAKIPTSNGGANFFSLGEADVANDGDTAFLDQDVSATDANAGVWGCGVEGLQGSFTVNGSVASGDDDAGVVTASFFNQLGNPIGSSSVPAFSAGDDGVFESFVIGSALVPENSADMNVELAGTDDVTNGTDDRVDVGYDDVSVTLTDCLDEFAKISGKVMSTGGQRGRWSFEGSVGILHVGGGLVFSDPFSINYKSEGFSCDFTPTDLSFDGTSALVEASYVCNGTGPTNATANAALIRLVPGTGGSEGPGKNKDRGDVCVDAIDAALDIPTVDSLCDVDGDATALKNGNVHTDEDTTNGP